MQWVDVYLTYRSIAALSQDLLTCCCCQWLCASDDALGAVHHTPTARKRLKRGSRVSSHVGRQAWEGYARVLWLGCEPDCNFGKEIAGLNCVTWLSCSGDPAASVTLGRPIIGRTALTLECRIACALWPWWVSLQNNTNH